MSMAADHDTSRRTRHTAQRKVQQIPRGDYDGFLGEMRRAFDNYVVGQSSLFTTEERALWATFIDNLPRSQRQHHTCNACRHFIERFGGLVAISDDGRTTPVMWGAVGGFYKKAFDACRKLVANAPVNGVFLSTDQVYGTPVTGMWKHMAVYPPQEIRYKFDPAVKDLGQAMAEKREEFSMLQRALEEFGKDLVEKAVGILESDVMFRSEKCIGPARWLLDLHTAIENATSRRRRDNIVWRAVSSAPVGFCHVRSTMIGTLLDDIRLKLPFKEIERRFREKMDPTQYMRPQSAPSRGQLDRAEKIVEALSSAGALERRYARLDEIEKLWTPNSGATYAERSARAAGVFSHITPKGAGRARGFVEIPKGATVTWVKFCNDVLPAAEHIEVLVPEIGPFIAFVTATNPFATPIIQWDDPGRRNPFNWYCYPHGSRASQWGLRAGTYVDVTAISLLPCMWNGIGDKSHHGAGVTFMLRGCRELHQTGGVALFPEVLKPEYHEIRHAIEAFSASRRFSGGDNANACGIEVRKGSKFGPLRVHVVTRGGKVVTTYDIDRWD